MFTEDLYGNLLNNDNDFIKNNSFTFNDFHNTFENMSDDYFDVNNEPNIFFSESKISSPVNLNNNKITEIIPSDNMKEFNYIELSNKSTNEKTNNKISCIVKKEKIFNIKKEKNSKQGRKRKNQAYINNEYTHTKDKTDNVLTKIKRNVNDNSQDLINIALSHSKNEKLKAIRLKKIDTSLITVSKKEENLNLLKMPLKEILSYKVSKKFTINYDPDYNKKQINKILKENDKELNNILNKDFLQMIQLYANPITEDNIFKYFRRIDEDIDKFKKDNVDDNYIKLYEDTANKFEDKIKAIFPRRKRKIN